MYSRGCLKLVDFLLIQLRNLKEGEVWPASGASDHLTTISRWAVTGKTLPCSLHTPKKLILKNLGTESLSPISSLFPATFAASRHGTTPHPDSPCSIFCGLHPHCRMYWTPTVCQICKLLEIQRQASPQLLINRQKQAAVLCDGA